MFASWQTTISGIAAAVTAVASAVQHQFDGNPSTEPQWGLAIAAVIGAIGLIRARDNTVTSEQAKAR